MLTAAPSPFACPGELVIVRDRPFFRKSDTTPIITQNAEGLENVQIKASEPLSFDAVFAVERSLVSKSKEVFLWIEIDALIFVSESKLKSW